MQRISLYAWIAIALLTVSALAGPGHADEADSAHTLTLALQPGALDDAGRAAAHEQRPAAFTEGSWTIEPLVFAVADVSYGAHVDVYGTALGASYYFADDLAIRGEAIGFFAKQTDDDSLAGGLSLHGRWHYYRRGGFTLFFEGGGGMIHASVSIPDAKRSDRQDGTNLNFTATAILGATFQLTENLHLNGAFRYLHISNARRHGLKRNPSTEGIGGHLGLIYTF